MAAGLLMACQRQQREAVPPTGFDEVLPDQPRMAMADGMMYYDAGRESTVTGRCGAMDGKWMVFEKRDGENRHLPPNRE